MIEGYCQCELSGPTKPFWIADLSNNTNVNVGNTVEKVEKQQRVEIELESEKNFCCIKAKAADSQKVITVFCD